MTSEMPLQCSICICIACNDQSFQFFAVKEKTRELMVWCFKSQGLQKVNHSELVVMLEVRKKEDIFPEEVLRVYKGILFLASKFGMCMITAPQSSHLFCFFLSLDIF